jgi:hypothetical protein
VAAHALIALAAAALIGHPAERRPIYSPDPPRHPHMAPNGRSNLHVDAYQTDVHQTIGPLGRDLRVRNQSLPGVCGSITFDSAGRIVTVCVGLSGPALFLLDPETLAPLATAPLPPRRPLPPGANIFNDFSGGGYFYLDDRDRAVIPTTDQRLVVVAIADGPKFVQEHAYSLASVLAPDDKVISALPDWAGRVWFASTAGVAGAVDPSSGAVSAVALGEKIANSFAVDDTGGVFVVTDRALYRLDAGPRVTWRKPYSNSGIAKPGQVGAGSGTTPTLMGRDFVAIADNADPMNVVVYRRDSAREVCRAPVFARGASATDQSLIGTARSLVVENNYGYNGPTATEGSRTTTPGLERVDLDRDGKGCHRVWRSAEIAPSVVPKLSAANGLVYTYTKPGGDARDPWYLTALDFRTGRTVYSRLAGEGLGFNNNYAPVTIGPDGGVYLGVLGGMVSFHDARPPASVRPEPPALRLRSRGLRSGAVRARLTGPDIELVSSVVFRLGKRRVRDARAPFARTLRGQGRVHAVVRLRDGRTVRL